MRLESLVTSFELLTPAQRLREVQGWRHRREVERPAAKAILKKVKKKEVNMQVVRLRKLLSTLSKKELAAVLEQLGNDNVHPE